jgi:hypothetical protein
MCWGVGVLGCCGVRMLGCWDVEVLCAGVLGRWGVEVLVCVWCCFQVLACGGVGYYINIL